jgi:hypothetical protein
MAHTEKAHKKTVFLIKGYLGHGGKYFGGTIACYTPTPLLEEDPQRPGLTRRLPRKVVPGLTRLGTFKRQQLEPRDRLKPIKPNHDERRTLSVDRLRDVT